MDVEYEVAFPVGELAAGQSDGGGVSLACAAPATFGGRSFGSAIDESERLPARTEVAMSLGLVAAAVTDRWKRGLPVGACVFESADWFLADASAAAVAV